MTSREFSYEQTRKPSLVDRIGVFLSNRDVIEFVKKQKPKRIADLGCGYNATLLQALRPFCDHLLGVDLATNQSIEGVELLDRRIEKDLSFLEDESVDFIVINSVLEHLQFPEEVLAEIYRSLSPGGSVFINVPNWRGKTFLEFSAFKLGLSPAEEMNDHKMYYDKRDLWPLIVRGGFRPQDIKLSSHKFGLNTKAYARK
jgi:SAM-dependent methyltransferase